MRNDPRFPAPPPQASATATATGGIGFCGMLTIALIVLKLTGHIDWSWVWVLAPIWVPAVFVCAFLAFIFLLVWIDYRKERRNGRDPK